MRFTIVGLLSLAMAAAAIPNPSANSKPGSVEVSPQCGNQIFACCSDIHLEVEKRQVGELLDGVVGIVDGLVGILGTGSDAKNCYNANQGAVCKGTSACCPGNGNKVSYPLLPSLSLKLI